MKNRVMGVAALAAVLVNACAPVPDDREEVATANQALTVAVGQGAIAYDMGSVEGLPHGVAGDRRLVFVSEALSGSVSVHRRLTGKAIADLPAPPGGFALPFALRVPQDGTLVVLDAGGFPDPSQPSVPVVYEYSYGLHHGAFHATLERTISFAGLPLAFVEDLEVLPDGRYVVSESVLGALWVVNTDGTIEMGVFPASFDPADAVPGLNPCGLPAGLVIDGIPFAPPGMFAPGVGSLAARDGWLYFGNSCLGGVRRIPVASLSDTTRLPFERGADIEVVSPRPQGVSFEVLKGLAFNRWSNDDRLFALDATGLGAVRIDVETGAREALVQDAELFNFPVSAQFLPPLLGVSPVVVISDQEHRLAAFNTGIGEDQLVPPFLITKVFLAP
ncbi:MAG: hypothetical protein R3B72_08810 [Polyangiaceae bacterium]